MSTKDLLKILVSGDVCGRFASFLKRIESVQKKSGPFDMVICVGDFFAAGSGNSDGSAGEVDAAVWKAVLSGQKHVSVPIFILGPNHIEQTAFYSDLAGYELAENIIYLGAHGCFTTKEGLKIAYFSGGSENKPGNPRGFSFEDYKAMEVQLQCNSSTFQGVDLLIASEWPQGVASHASLLGIDPNIGSKIISKLALKLKPRYHFAGLHGIHYERQPYRNHRILNEATRHVTRFIGLDKVDNPDKKKWLYAFNIQPMKTMDRAELIVQPTDVTDAPYNDTDLKSIENASEARAQFFYDMNAPMTEDNRNKRRHDERDRDFKRPKPTGPCWFCLSGEEVEKHLVISIGEHAYLALPKGGLTPEHVLILPIAHYSSSLHLPQEAEQEIEKFKTALAKCFKKQGKAIVAFERNYKSHHMQLNVVPVPKESSDRVKELFLEIGDSQQIELTEVPEHATLAQMAQPGTPFFYVETPTKERLFHRVRSNFPIHFGRDVLASGELLDLPQRIDWRECKADMAEEAKMAKDFRTLFQPFDFTLEDE